MRKGAGYWVGRGIRGLGWGGCALVAVGLWACLVVLFHHRPSGVVPQPVVYTNAATMPDADPPTVTLADPARAAKCKKLLNSVHIWKSWKRNGDYVTVEVRPAFYAADFDDKRVFDGVVRCVAAEGRVEDQGLTVVEYIDARTHKTAATWSKYAGFSVEE